MKIIKKLISLGIVVTLSAAVLAGCGSKASSGETAKQETKEAATETSTEATQANEEAADTEATKTAASDITIGLVPMTLSNDYFVTMANGAKQEAAKQGVEVLVQAGVTHDDAEGQLETIENFIQQGVDAIAIVPSNSASLATALKEAQDAGIPVINIDTLFDADVLTQAGIDIPPFYGTDNYAGAEAAADYAINTLFPDKDVINVALLTGIAGQQNAADRRNGFVDKAGAKINIVAEQAADWDIEKGYNATQTILQANSELDLVFAGNDEMALGALKAIQEAGRDVKVIGFDGTASAADSVEQGGLSATIAQDPGKMGVLAIQESIKAINGEELPAKTDTGTTLVTKDTVATYKEYLAQYTDK